MANNKKNDVNTDEKIDKDILVISEEVIRERTYIYCKKSESNV